MFQDFFEKEQRIAKTKANSEARICEEKQDKYNNLVTKEKRRLQKLLYEIGFLPDGQVKFLDKGGYLDAVLTIKSISVQCLMTASLKPKDLQEKLDSLFFERNKWSLSSVEKYPPKFFFLKFNINNPKQAARAIAKAFAIAERDI